MKIQKAKKISMILLTAVILSIVSFAGGIVYAERNIKVVIDGNTISTDVAPFIRNGRTFVPLRAVAEGLGMPVKWDDATSTVYIGKVPEGLDLVNDLKPFKCELCILDDNNPVSISGVKYSHGYNGGGIFEEVYWNLGGKYNTLEFSTGISDDKYWYNSSECVIEIYGDGELLKRISGLTHFDGIKKYTIDIKGVKVLGIKVPYNDMPIINPRVN